MGPPVHCGLWHPSTPRAPPSPDGRGYAPDADWVREPFRQLLVDAEQPAQPDKRAHDLDVHLHGAGTPQDAGQHGHTLLGERVGPIFAMLPSPTLYGHKL